MPRLICQWTACKHNSECASEKADTGDCNHDGPVELECVGDVDEQVLNCKQFEWGNEE